MLWIPRGSLKCLWGTATNNKRGQQEYRSSSAKKCKERRSNNKALNAFSSATALPNSGSTYTHTPEEVHQYTRTAKQTVWSFMYVYIPYPYHIAMANAFLFGRCSLTVGDLFLCFWAFILDFRKMCFCFFFFCFILLFYAFSFVLNCIFCCADPALLLLHFSNKCIISTSSPSSWPKNLHQMWC